jgi:hypothetical protein
MKFPKLPAQVGLAGIAIAVLIFIIVLVVYGEVVNALNTEVFSDSVVSLIALIPLVLVGAALVYIVITALRYSQ